MPAGGYLFFIRKSYLFLLLILLRKSYDYPMSYVFYNPNPYHKRTTDCVVRALCVVTGMEWRQVYVTLMSYALDIGEMADMAPVWKAFLRERGFKTYVIPDTCPACYTVKDFCREHSEGTYVLAINGHNNHVVAVVDGDYYDTWDSGDEIPVFYMRKE